jgi:hypothetical protein
MRSRVFRAVLESEIFCFEVVVPHLHFHESRQPPSVGSPFLSGPKILTDSNPVVADSRRDRDDQ